MKIKRLTQKTIALSAVCAAVLAPLPANACAFSNDVFFSYDNHPDFPLHKYAAGHLEILQPGYARSYLFVADRVLSGHKLTDEEQKGVVALWLDRMNRGFLCDDDTSGTQVWLKARNAVAKTKVDSIYCEKEVSSDGPWQQFLNIQSDAFKNATSTLQAIITKYGATSAATADWLKAQDEVFATGGSPYDSKPAPKKLPTPLPESADPALKRYRKYQIAAANFYAGNYENARKEFDQIAADKDSPFHSIAGYLSVRALLREASLAKTPDMNLYAQAGKRIGELLASNGDGSLKAALVKLQNFIEVRENPTAFIKKMTQQPFTKDNLTELTKAVDLVLNDDGTGESPDAAQTTKEKQSLAKINDTLDWVVNEDAGHSWAEWNKTHQIKWLVSAAMNVEPANKDATSIAAECEKHLDPSSPAYWTLLYNANRIQLAHGKGADVSSRLDKAMASATKELSPSSLNRLKTQRLHSVKTLDEFITYGVQTPAAMITSGGVDGVPDDTDKLEAGAKSKDVVPSFSSEGATVLDTETPVAKLVELCQKQSIPTKLRNHLIWTTWCRAILVSDDASAATLAPLVKSGNSAKGKYIDKYLAATTPADKKFAAADLMLHFSSAVPNVGFGIINPDTYGDEAGWWWSDKPVADYSADNSGLGTKAPDKFTPPLFTAAETAQAKSELQKLKTLQGAPNYFAGIVLPYAKAHMTDPRVPEVLNFYVKATHWGTTDDKTKAHSKEAFNILHTQFKANPWTKKTPYFY